MTPARHPSRSIMFLSGLWLFVIMLVYQLTLAVRTGLADIYAAPAIVYLLHQQESDAELEDSEWQAIEANLNRARALAPDTPRYLSHLGWLQQIRLRQEEETLSEDERAQPRGPRLRSLCQGFSPAPDLAL